jgi:hypothetical protein
MFNFHKVIVAGGRDFNDYEKLSKTLENFRNAIWNGNHADEIEIVSGGARGADSLGERWAKENHVGVMLFPAEWDKHGKAAGPIRNEQMGDYADSLIAFWDGKSRGTAHMIKYAKDNGLNVIVVNY